MVSLISVTRMLATIAVGFSSLCALTATGIILPPAKTTRIDGKLTLNGQPVRQATVVFSPRQSPFAEGWGVGTTDLDGKFEITPGGDDPGLKPGDYTVHLLKSGPVLPNDAEGDVVLRNQIPSRYYDVATTNILVGIDGSASCRVNIDLPGHPGTSVAAK